MAAAATNLEFCLFPESATLSSNAGVFSAAAEVEATPTENNILKPTPAPSTTQTQLQAMIAAAFIRFADDRAYRCLSLPAPAPANNDCVILKPTPASKSALASRTALLSLTSGILPSFDYADAFSELNKNFESYLKRAGEANPPDFDFSYMASPLPNGRSCLYEDLSEPVILFGTRNAEKENENEKLRKDCFLSFFSMKMIIIDLLLLSE